MPYARPTLTQLRDQVLQDIAAAEITDPQSGALLVVLLQQAVLRIVAYAQAGLSYEHYGYLDWIAKQAVPWTAKDEFLEGWAELKGVYREAATPTQGTVSFTGTAGSDFPAGTSISRQDGYAYTSTADAAVSGTSVTVTIEAVQAGSAGNFAANTPFTISGSVPGVMAQSTGSAQTVPGTDAELDDSLRSRMLLAYANPPQGGARSDYLEWALAVPGVTRAWVAPLGMGAGTVVVYVMFDEAEAANGGFPQGSNGVAAADSRDAPATGDQLTVANALFPEQPVPALVYVCAPVAQPVDFTISDLGSANTGANQALMTAALSDMLLRTAQVGGATDPATGAVWEGLEPSDWFAALEAVPGLSEFSVPVPAAKVVPNTGSLLTLGVVTFLS